MKERPIIMGGASIRAILDGRKVQTRRVIKPQPQALYRLTDDRIYAILSPTFLAEAIDNDRGRVATNSHLSERRLQSRLRWADILKDALQGLWAKGIRGLVSVEGTSDQEGLSDHIIVSQQSESHSHSTSLGLHGLSWIAAHPIISGATFEWQPAGQQADQSCVGNASGELGRPQGTWAWDDGGESPDDEAVRRRLWSSKMGYQKGVVQPTPRGKNAWTVPGWRISHCPFEIGQHLWVRETWRLWYDEPVYRATPPQSNVIDFTKLKWKSPIYMPKKFARIWLEITDVRVERLQEINEQDISAEGVRPDMVDSGGVQPWGAGIDVPDYHSPFIHLWDSLNAKRGYGWETNPWVWVVSFKVVS